MSKQTVVVSSCDRCHKEVTMALSKVSQRGHDYDLPDKWLHVSGNTKSSLVFEMHLCEDCKQIVLEAAGAARG